MSRNKRKSRRFNLNDQNRVLFCSNRRFDPLPGRYTSFKIYNNKGVVHVY